MRPKAEWAIDLEAMRTKPFKKYVFIVHPFLFAYHYRSYSICIIINYFYDFSRVRVMRRAKHHLGHVLQSTNLWLKRN